MRLDVFLPLLRKPKQGESAARARMPVRAARFFSPRSLFSDRQTAAPGLVRRLLKKVGPSWVASPVRRLIQTIAFLVFLWLFFYVCWPYSARPSPVWRGWIPVEFDVDSARVTVVTGQPPDEAISAAATLYVVDESMPEQAREPVSFQVVAARGLELTLQADEGIAPQRLEALAFSAGPWSLHQQPPRSWPSHHADNLASRERLPAESFLVIDPLVSLSTAIAAKSWVWSLACAAAILTVCVLFPRAFCGYLCPLGTSIDLFDRIVSSRVKRLRVGGDGWWVHIKYYLLLATVIAAMFGVLISGYVAAVPVMTRAMLFLFEPLQIGLTRGWHQVPPIGAGQVVSVLLLAIIFGLGLLGPRFWCKYVCPSGAVFSLGNLLRLSQRKVESSCIHCNKCVEICPFDAIKADFTTRVTDCTLCQTCGGVCPTHSIKFVERWNSVDLKVADDPPTGETPIGRRGFLSLASGTAVAVAGGIGMTAVTKGSGAWLDEGTALLPVRPPGSVPEREFLQLCIRCGECFKVCPNHVLEPISFQQGLDGLWTPRVNADRAGCDASCNNCGQVCPSGAIRALPMEEKRVCRMGLAIVDQATCLPLAGAEACQLCVDECTAAGYDAIEFTAIGTEVDDFGLPIEGTGMLAPVVRNDRCVGCGLCQTRCFSINARQKGLLKQSAIVVRAGEGKEDRLRMGSYRELREREAAARSAAQEQIIDTPQDGDSYLPDFLK